jgi:hypothetical protein
VGGIRRVCGQFGRDWEAGLRRLPFFTQRTAVLLLGVLVATRERRLGIDVAFARPAASAGLRMRVGPARPAFSRCSAAWSRSPAGPGPTAPPTWSPVSRPAGLRCPARGPATRPLPGPGRRRPVTGPGPTPVARRRPPRPQRTPPRPVPMRPPPGNRSRAARPPGARRPPRRPPHRRPPPRRAPSTRSTTSSARWSPPWCRSRRPPLLAQPAPAPARAAGAQPAPTEVLVEPGSGRLTLARTGC